MGRVHAQLDERLTAFIRRQRLFFVATAPLDPAGHVNCSPKGLDTFAVLDPTTVAYLDLTGSGVETLAHLRENGRLTFLFCALEGPPKLLRLYGRGEVIAPDHPEWQALRARFPDYPGARAVVRVALERIADSCGFGVPLYEYRGERRQLLDWAERKGAEGLAAYREENNRRSIDGLPGL